MSLTKDNIKRVQKLEQALAALKSGQIRYFSITKLISIKSLCRNDDLRREYCFYLSSLVMSQAEGDKTPTEVKRLCQEAVSAIRKVANDPEYADGARETLQTMVRFQDTIVKMKWSNVRIVKNNSLFVLEKILQVLLSSGDVAKGFDGNRPADIVLQGEPFSNMGGDDLACGDFNHDGYGDVLAGAYNYPGAALKHGRTYLFYGGSKQTIDTDCDRIFEGERGKGDYFGMSVSAGDVNHDGIDDVLIGADGAHNLKGRAFLYYGPFDSTASITFNWDTTNVPPGKHTLKASIAPVAGEGDVADNTMTVTVEVKETFK